MSRVPLGKVLLRNVIRQTDAHNKIQEESDMWKIRELEKQMEDAYRGTKRKMLPSSSRRMCSDGFDEESQRDCWRPKNEISEALKMIFLRLNRGIRSYMIMKLICQTDGVTVVIKSYTLKNLKQTVVISKILPIPQASSRKKLGLLVPGKGNSHISTRKNPGKSLSKNLLYSWMQKVTLPSQMIPHPAVLRKVRRDTKKTKRKKT
ncbi:hypothetical protein GH733_014885 [Mirounga leonina]|nr:hypothetical protein GH733_014885 [Mirounga leonina]